MPEITEDQTHSKALVKSETRIETMKHPQGDREIARGNRGKFVRKIQALTEVSTKQMAELLLRKGEDGKTTLQALREHVIEVAMKATDEKSLIGLAKILTTLEDSAGITAQREAAIKEANTEKINPIRVVIIQQPEGVKPMEEPKPEKTKPSWIEAEVVAQNAAQGRDKV